MDHLATLETMHNIGDINQMSLVEWLSLNKFTETFEMTDREIGNCAPESRTEDG